MEPILAAVRAVEGVDSNDALFSRPSGVTQVVGELVLRASKFPSLTKQVADLKKKKKHTANLDKQVVRTSRQSISLELKLARKAAADKRKHERKKAKELAQRKKEEEKLKKQQAAKK